MKLYGDDRKERDGWLKLFELNPEEEKTALDVKKKAEGKKSEGKKNEGKKSEAGKKRKK